MKDFLNDLADWIPVFVIGGAVILITISGLLGAVQLILQQL